MVGKNSVIEQLGRTVMKLWWEAFHSGVHIVKRADVSFPYDIRMYKEGRLAPSNISYTFK